MEITKEELNYVFDVIKTLITGMTSENFEKNNKSLNIFSRANYHDQLLSIIDGLLATIANREKVDEDQLITSLVKHLIFLLAVKARLRRTDLEKNQINKTLTG